MTQELESVYGFQPRGKKTIGSSHRRKDVSLANEHYIVEKAGLLILISEVMISQRKGEFPPVAFMTCSNNSVHRMLKAEKAFENAFAIAFLPIPPYSNMQALAISTSVKIKMFTGT
ncbi:hypothetical protein PsorP6_000072 [Peronosclerospora sorghi]|uniref:Uncharacterized protein n=1 Tax=Peronosclerospora sorghi TaxID=230839 RepID=A0ACC0WTG7_9STRA|nr:hypothetical protein PsorP6_000072 [Peronosclerospora sorghi]